MIKKLLHEVWVIADAFDSTADRVCDALTSRGARLFRFEVPAHLTVAERWHAATECRYGIGGCLTSLPVPYLNHPSRAAVAAYMKLAGLTYGAFDFLVRGDESLVALEINPEGNYSWIEEETALPISDAIADVLIEQDPS